MQFWYQFCLQCPITIHNNCILLLVQQKRCWGFEKLLPLSEPCMQHQNIASHAAEIYNQSRLVSNIVKTIRLEMETLESPLSDDFNFIKLCRSDNHRGHASNCRALWRRILSIVSLLGGNIKHHWNIWFLIWFWHHDISAPTEWTREVATLANNVGWLSAGGKDDNDDQDDYDEDGD